jgi:nucleoside-diphosphate-sugar epimerase
MVEGLGRKVLIIGGSGLLGHQFSNVLLSQKYSLLRVGNSESKFNDVRMNLHDIASFRKLLKEYKPTHVINTAWVTNPLEYRNSIQNRTYMYSSIELGKLCVENDVSVYVGIGSSAEYGATYGVLNCEVDKEKPDNNYGFYKNETFRRMQQLFFSTPVNFLWLRIFQAYGPGEHKERLIPSLIDTLSNGNRFTIQNPSMELDFITSRDISKALLYCLEKELQGCVDVGTSRGTSVASLAIMIREMIGRGSLRVSEDHKWTPSNRRIVSPDSRLFKEGWTPKDNLTEGLRWVISSKI